MDNIREYNPLDRMNLGNSVADALVESDMHNLSNLEQFEGTGIYCIYYAGDFPSYKKLVEKNLPIYVGQAVAPGARKGINIISGTPSTTALYTRLQEHNKSIESAENLNSSDFKCRALIVDDIWIPLGEALLIANFSPVWNTLIDGFGNHDPGKGRYNGTIPKWDVLHPGRSWAKKLQLRDETPEMLAAEVSNHLISY